MFESVNNMASSAVAHKEKDKMFKSVNRLRVWQANLSKPLA